MFKFGKKIYDKLNEAMNPQFADEQPMNPFDPWAGANFKLKIRNVEGYRNYDKSEFAAAAPLFENDNQIEAIWKQEHSLQAFLSPSNFKTYEELKAKLNKVLNLDESTPAGSRQAAANRKQNDEDDLPWKESAPQREASARPTPSTNTDDDDGEDLEFFKRLAS